MKTANERAWRSSLLLAALLMGCSCATERLTHGIPNFAEVGAGVIRGGQPTQAGWNYLASLGISNVVKLDTDQEGSDQAAQALGMRVAYVPMTGWQQMFGPVAPQVAIAVTNITPGTFVHCRHGQDRTGLVVACWRVEHGWTKTAAEAEMMRRGFHRSLRGLWEYWRESVRE